MNENQEQVFNWDRPLILSKRVAEQLYVLAAQHGSREACGLLFGEECDDVSIVNELISLPNLSKRPHRFLMSAVVSKRIQREMTSTCIALFHTHEHDASPSESDLDSLRLSSVTWLICAPDEMCVYAPNVHRRTLIIEEEIS
ncbi:MAG: Mov34/MPN/PAD-1 family protein [Gammaproteobacteria bacterium]